MISLLEPSGNFDDIMYRAKDYMLVNEALQSIDDDTPSSSGEKATKGNREQKMSEKPRLPPSTRYTLLNRPWTEILNHIKEE